MALIVINICSVRRKDGKKYRRIGWTKQYNNEEDTYPTVPREKSI